MTKSYNKFENLECWKESRKLVNEIYSITNSQSFSKDFGLKDQIRRASVSIMANIAEGFGTFSDLEFIRFLSYSNRSCQEVSSHLYVALDVGYIDKDLHEKLLDQSCKCSNYIKSFIRYLKLKSDKHS